MHDFLEIQCFSPISSHNFNSTPNLEYYLIITNIQNDKEMFIYTINLPQIQNVTDETRSFLIRKHLKINTSKSSPYFIFRIFEFNKPQKSITLLFSQKLNLNTIENDNINNIFLYTPKIKNNLITHNFSDYTSLLSEHFYTYEQYDINEKCIIFLTKTSKHISPKNVLPITVKFNTDYIYNVYYDSVIKETNSPNNFDLKLRKSIKDIDAPFNSNVLTSPIDSKLKIFKILDNLLIKLDGTPHRIHQDFKNGIGFIFKKRKHDLLTLTMPFSGKLKEKTNLGPNHNMLIFDNTYFIPPSESERELISVFLGHRIYESKFYPAAWYPQEKIKLSFAIIYNKNSTNINISDKFQYQDEEIGTIPDEGDLIILFNRPVACFNKIEHFSSLNIYTYLKNKDIIGLII